jgi:hypothetical protein
LRREGDIARAETLRIEAFKMRAETQAVAEQIQQSLALLRRHL